MNVFVVASNDLVKYGNGTKNVKIFLNKEDAKSYMKEEYLKKCKEENIEEPFKDNHSIGYQYGYEYAFIEDRYYWDIFDCVL